MLKPRGAKETIAVTIMTVNGYRMTGEMHISPSGRITDEINRDTLFLPITKVTIYNAADQQINKMAFTVVNKNNVVLISPHTEGDS